MTAGEMPLDRLRIRDDERGFVNPRSSSGLDDASLRELALAIGRVGLLNRLRVTPDGVILAGQRRYQAIAILQRWRELLADLVEPDEVALFDRRAGELVAAVPVEIQDDDAPEALEGVALADNLDRADLSSYEIAAYVGAMDARGMTGATIARAVGKSRSWVSRTRAAWRGAGAALRAAWRAGELTLDQVQHLAEFSEASQEAMLRKGAPRGVRGPANRPGIDQVKEALRVIASETGASRVIEQHGLDYVAGVADALRWVAGQGGDLDLDDLLNPKPPTKET